MISASELQAYLETMRAGGCTRFRCGDLEVEMAPSAPVRADAPQGRKLTEQDWMFAASEGLPVEEPEQKERS